MKISILILPLLVFFSCETKPAQKLKADAAAQKEIESENRKFFVGDINNDKISDTAVVNYQWNIKTNEIECGEKNCWIDVVFNNDIEKISFDQTLGIVVAKTEDLNHDHANEIIVFSRTNRGWWNDISVWSFQNKTWNMIAKTEGFISDDADFENRIIKENNKYYLIGEDWNMDENGDFKKIKVKIQ